MSLAYANYLVDIIDLCLWRLDLCDMSQTESGMLLIFYFWVFFWLVKNTGGSGSSICSLKGDKRNIATGIGR